MFTPNKLTPYFMSRLRAKTALGKVYGASQRHTQFKSVLPEIMKMANLS